MNKKDSTWRTCKPLLEKYSTSYYLLSDKLIKLKNPHYEEMHLQLVYVAL